MARVSGSCSFQECRQFALSFETGASRDERRAPDFQAIGESVGVRTNFLIPALEQLFALGRFAIGLEIVIDELDVLEAR